jgi:hypothetical protein
MRRDYFWSVKLPVSVLMLGSFFARDIVGDRVALLLPCAVSNLKRQVRSASAFVSACGYRSLVGKRFRNSVGASSLSLGATFWHCNDGSASTRSTTGRLLSLGSGVKTSPSYKGKAATPEEWIASIARFMLAQECGTKVPLHVLAKQVPRPEGVKGDLSKLLANSAKSLGLNLTGKGNSLELELSANTSWILLIAKYLHQQEEGTRVPLHVLGAKVPRPEGTTGNLGKLLEKQAESFGLILVCNRKEVEVTLSPTSTWILSIVKHLRAQEAGTEVPLHILAAKVPRPDGARGNLGKVIARMAEAFGLALTGSGDSLSVGLVSRCFERKSMTSVTSCDERKLNNVQQPSPTESASSSVADLKDCVEAGLTPDHEGVIDYPDLIAQLDSGGLILQERALRDEALEQEQKETDFLCKVQEHRSRHSTCGAELEAVDEVDLLDRIAGIYGCADQHSLVEKIAVVWGEDKQIVRSKLIIATKEAIISAKQRILDLMPNASAESQRIDDYFSSFRMGVQDRALPTTHKIPSNQEVDDHHDKCMALAAIPGSWTTIGNAEKSPYGVLASGVGLDELSEVRLQSLFSDPRGPVHCFKIMLTVVKPAFMAVAVTAVVADSSGQHIRIAVYNTGCASTAQAQLLLPLGSRFCLNQPFLKRCSDSWLGLRVDEPRSLVRLDLPMSGRILVVGDGDFSFSRALCRRNTQFGSKARITATSLDCRESVLGKYPGAASILEELDMDPLVEVLHRVDAMSLLSHMRNRSPFDIVVWNFPYPVISAPVQAGEGAALLDGFLASVGEAAVLSEGGRVYITLANAQGGSTREAKRLKNSWRIEDVAAKKGFNLLEVIPFNVTEYAGYTPRRAFSDESFPHADARVHILQRCHAQQRQTTASSATGYERLGSKDRHLGGRLASAIHSAPFRCRALSPQSGRGVIPNCLASFAAKSATARSLLVAEQTFDEVFNYISKLSSLDYADNAVAKRVVALLNKAYSVRDGELLASWPNDDVFNFALSCALSTCGKCFAEVNQDAELAAASIGGKLSLEDLLLAVTKPRVNSAGHLTQAQGDLLCSSAYVLSCLLMHCERKDPVSCVDGNSMQSSPRPGREAAGTAWAAVFMVESLVMLSLPIKLKIADARIYRRIACIFAFRVNILGDDQERKPETEQALREILAALLAICEHLLNIDPNDIQSMHLKAFALRSYPLTGGVPSPLDMARFEQAIALHEQYLALAEPDDRFRADAHYSIGALQLMLGLRSAEASTKIGAVDAVVLSALKHYHRGLEAERSQLPCIPPRGPVDAKELLANVRAAYPTARR